MKDHTHEPTATEERIAENTPAPPIAPIPTDLPTDPATGLPEGMHDDDRSPLDFGKPG